MPRLHVDLDLLGTAEPEVTVLSTRQPMIELAIPIAESGRLRVKLDPRQTWRLAGDLGDAACKGFNLTAGPPRTDAPVSDDG